MTLIITRGVYSPKSNRPYAWLRWLSKIQFKQRSHEIPVKSKLKVSVISLLAALGIRLHFQSEAWSEITCLMLPTSVPSCQVGYLGQTDVT